MRCPACAAPCPSIRCGSCGAAYSAGTYLVERVLQEGPSGRVYVARDAKGAAVALKELVFRLIPSAAELLAFEREADMLRQVDHPRIPRLVEVFREGEGVDLRLYIVSAFVEGVPLDRLLEAGPLPLEEVLGIGREVLSLLSYLHGLSPKVLHRDIKPANLVQSAADGTTWLVDFGAARDLKLGVTYGTTMVGTYGYMAPEQLGGAASERSDLYAVGATLLHLVTGRAPTAIIRAGKRVDLASAGVPRRLRRLLTALLAEDPEKRPRSANDALRLLDAKPVWPAMLAVLTVLAIPCSVLWAFRRAVDVPIVQSTAASSSGAGSSSTRPGAAAPLPALAYPLQARVPIPRDKTSCKSANAALELLEVSSNWGGTGDPSASAGLHGLKARFINKGTEECCPPSWNVETESGTVLQTPGGAWDVPMDIMCMKPGATDSWAGAASVHIGFTTPVGTRKVRVRVAFDHKSAFVTINLETGETSLRYEKEAP